MIRLRAMSHGNTVIGVGQTLPRSMVFTVTCFRAGDGEKWYQIKWMNIESGTNSEFWLFCPDCAEGFQYLLRSLGITFHEQKYQKGGDNN